MAQNETAVDFLALKLPSDGVTIRQMREQQPELLAPRGQGDSRSDVFILAALVTEQELAEKAYADAAGLPDPWPQWGRRDMIESLNDEYCRYGLSTGTRMTYELVREFERAAAKQAQDRYGPSQGL